MRRKWKYWITKQREKIQRIIMKSKSLKSMRKLEIYERKEAHINLNLEILS